MENKRWKKSVQLYKKVWMGNSAQFYVKQDKSIKMINVRRVETYSNTVYVSNKVKIKPRALHTIVSHAKAALKTYRIKSKQMPTIVILSDSELPTAYGRYDAIQNVVYYIPEIADKKIMGQDFGIIEYHEMWHLKQANDFREKEWNITEENYQQYMTELCRVCKKKIDALDIRKYNVGEISAYAKKMYSTGRFDEVEAEYMSQRRKGDKK